MASPAGSPPQPSPEQIAMMRQQHAMEAQKRGITPQQLEALQRKQLSEEAAKAGMSLEQYVNKIKKEAFEHYQRQQQQQQQMMAQQQQAGQMQAQGQPQAQSQQGQQVPITPGAPDPKALALANFLKGQDLKVRTCLLNGGRKDMFRVKRALRAIQSEAYTKAQKKNPLLPPPPQNPTEACEIFKLLPLSLLALRVSKIDPHAGHDHGKQKRVKGLWTVKIEQQQDISEDLHYVWLYEGSQWKTKLYAVLALLAIVAVVMFPLWPLFMRVGVWYLSMGVLGLVGLFIAMSIFRLILFCITVVTLPKGLWLYPNLFEDVGFFDSFRPVWAWQEDKKKGPGSKKSSSSTTSGSGKKKSKKSKDASSRANNKSENGSAEQAAASTTSPPSAPDMASSSANDAATPGNLAKRVPAAHAAPRVEEIEDE